MENQGLLFIPDISGFTRFVSQMEIEHSRNIIQELLETIINANEIGLRVSEVEGDAILFYKFGDMPDLQQLYQQVEKMFIAFHKQLGAYAIRRYCQCPACTAAVGLSLKIITHYGEFTGYTVKEFNKLIGKDVIVAHQLLKNDLDQHEYWLITDNLVKDSKPGGFKSWMKWDSHIKKTEEGDIPFHYTPLGELKNEVPPDQPLQLEIENKVEVCSVSAEYDAHIFKAFHASGDFHYRQKWRDGVSDIQELTHFMPRVGMRCRYLMDNQEVVIYASSYSFQPEHIEFTETEEGKTKAYHYILESLGPERTRVTIRFYIKRNVLEQLKYRLWKGKKMKESLHRSLGNLEKVLDNMSDQKPEEENLDIL